MDAIAIKTRRDPIKLKWKPIPNLIRLSLKLFFLRIFTLGLYHFWGKADVRRRIWAAIVLHGQPFEYTGTGKELFLGFVAVSFLFIVPLYISFTILLLFKKNNFIVSEIIQNLFILVLLYLFGVAQYRARRYRLTRTRWRGIRWGMSGSSWRFGLVSFLTYLLIPISAGWIIPWRDRVLQNRLVNETRFGTTALKFDPHQINLYSSFAISWFGVIFILLVTGYLLFYFFGPQLTASFGQKVPPQPSTFAAFAVFLFLTYVLIVAANCVYHSKKFNCFIKATSIDQMKLELHATPLSLARLYLGNILLTTLTLGLATPIVQSRIVGYFVTRMSIEGSLDFTRIEQDYSKTERIGEGLAEAFDIDAF